MRTLTLLTASFLALSLSGCSSVSKMWSHDGAQPAAKVAADKSADKNGAPAAADKADDKAAAPASDSKIAASAREESELSALMGEKSAAGDSAATIAIDPKDVPPPPVMDPGAASDKTPADKTPADKTPPHTPVAGAPADCPGVEVLPDTRSITYFDDPDGRPLGGMIARAALVDIRGGCDYNKDSVVVDIDMIMKGKITDKGRYQGHRDLEAFMTFPYFVAIMDPSGKMVDKKIMATAMRFKPFEDDLDHAEKITQTIPLPDISQGAQYTITLGFQLNRAQLEYNRGSSSDSKADTARAPAAEPAKAPEKTPAKKSKTPKKAALAAPDDGKDNIGKDNIGKDNTGKDTGAGGKTPDEAAAPASTSGDAAKTQPTSAPTPAATAPSGSKMKPITE